MNDALPLSAPGPRYQATLQLLRTADALWNSSRIFFQRWDLSPSQFNILNLLTGENRGLTQTALSRALIMHRSNVTGLVDRLEKRGLVARQEEPGDRRIYRVILTRKGSRLLEEILPHYYRGAEEIWGAISASEAGKLAAMLARVGDLTQQVAKDLSSPSKTGSTEKR
jgi:DNA-binding MarR family transcriptional regulator